MRVELDRRLAQPRDAEGEEIEDSRVRVFLSYAPPEESGEDGYYTIEIEAVSASPRVAGITFFERALGPTQRVAAAEYVGGE